MNVKNTIYNILKKIKDKKPDAIHEEFSLTLDEFGNIIDLMLEEKLITNAIVVRAGVENIVETIHLRFAKITIKGFYFLEENRSPQFYKGIQQPNCYDLETMESEMPNLNFLTLRCPHCTDATGNFADIILSIPKDDSNEVATNCSCNGQVEGCAFLLTLKQSYNAEQLLKKCIMLKESK